MILESSPFCLKSFHCCIFSLALSVFWIPTDKDDGHISHCLIQFEHVFVINNTELIDKHCYNTIQKAEISRVGLDCSSSNNFRSLYVIKAERRFWSLCQGNEMVCTDAVSSSVTLINGSLILDIHVYCFLSLFSDLIMRFLLYKREQYLWRHIACKDAEKVILSFPVSTFSLRSGKLQRFFVHAYLLNICLSSLLSLQCCHFTDIQILIFLNPVEVLLDDG